VVNNKYGWFVLLCQQTFSLGPHCTYFRMRELKPQVAKVSTVASVMRDKYSFHF